MSQDPIESVMQESRTFAPPAEFASRAHLSSMEDYRALHRRSLEDPAGFWGEIAAQLHWFKPWDRVFDESDKPVLVGVRPNGRRLRVEAMSTGTRDQLYLALRLATLDHYIDSSEPLPFVVDD